MKKLSLPALLFLTLLSACIAAGCSVDSKKHITVQEKTELNTDSYRQSADAPEDSVVSDSADSDSGSNRSSGSADPDSGSNRSSDNADPDSGSSHSTASGSFSPGDELAGRLLVPESNTFFQEFPKSSLQLSCRARIELPDTDQVSVFKVGQKPFDQSWIDRVTHVFFGGLPVYDYAAYKQPTKEWAREKLRRLRAFQAEGLTDPYGHIASARKAGSQNPENLYNLEKDIEHWEEILKEAPEEPERIEVTPGFDTSASEPESADSAYGRSYFSGIVEMDGDLFQYNLKKSGPSHMEIQILRESGEDPDHTWFGYDWNSADLPVYSVSRGGYVPSQEKAGQIAGITPSAAVKMTDQYMEKLGLSDFSVKYTKTSLSYCQPEDLQAERIFIDAGYRVVYTRDISGFPVTYEISPGGAYESEYIPEKTWGYEAVEFYVNQEGLQKAAIRNLYEIEERIADNVELLPFPEIMDIFGQMMPLRFSESSGKYTIHRITLGYTRIYDPGMDSTTGLLVPVWDFFGTWKRNSEGDETSVLSLPVQSLLTINAADGTIINRGYGY